MFALMIPRNVKKIEIPTPYVTYTGAIGIGLFLSVLMGIFVPVIGQYIATTIMAMLGVGVLFYPMVKRNFNRRKKVLTSGPLVVPFTNTLYHYLGDDRHHEGTIIRYSCMNGCDTYFVFRNPHKKFLWENTPKAIYENKPPVYMPPE